MVDIETCPSCPRNDSCPAFAFNNAQSPFVPDEAIIHAATQNANLAVLPNGKIICFTGFMARVPRSLPPSLGQTGSTSEVL